MLETGKSFSAGLHLARGTAALLGIARQFAAAFRACGKGGAIPAATESLNECDCVHHAAAENIYGSEFVGEGSTLSGGHFQITRDAALVTCPGQFQVFLGCDDGFVLNLGFVLEDSQRGYVVFDLLEAGQDGLAIVGDALIVESDGLV